MGVVIDSVNWEKETGQIKAYVRNLDSFTELTGIYVNGKLDNQVTIVPRQLTLNQTAEITLTEVYWIMPKQITIAVHASNFTMVHTQTFIGFEMLRLYWNESTHKIVALVTDVGSYPTVDFGKFYVDGNLDDAAVISPDSIDYRGFQIYRITLSSTYLTRPTSMSLTITTADGTSFILASPFSGEMDISALKWNQSTGRLSFLAYIPSSHFLEGKQPVAFEGIYIDGTKVELTSITRAYSETYEIVPSKTYATCPSQVTVKAVTDFGAFDEKNYRYTGTYFEEVRASWSHS